MIKLTIKQITTILTRLLYLTIASVLLVALLTTVERGLPPALRSRLGSSSQAARHHQTDEGTWTTYNTSNSGLANNYVYVIAIDEEGNKWFGTWGGGVSKFDGTAWATYTVENTSQRGDQVTIVTNDTPVGSEWVPVGFASWEEARTALAPGYVIFGDDLTVYRYLSYRSHYDLKYAYQDASGWHIETVESEEGVGEYTSLALDKDGYPHISHCDGINHDLKYAYQDGFGWHIETVDSTSDSSDTSLALDGGRYPHISYRGRGIKYAYQDASGWHIETVYSGGYVGGDTSLALEEDEYPHISYHDGGLKYAYRDASGWHIETVQSGAYVGWDTSLALDGDGYPHISYYDATGGGLRYAHQDASGWHIETVDSTGQYTSLALDRSEYPHISSSGGGLKYAYQDASGWHIETVDSEEWVGWYTSLALDGDGYPHISYWDWSNADLKYAYQDASGWHIEIVDSEGWVGRYTSLALDGDGYPHISYRSLHSSGSIKIAPPLRQEVSAGAPVYAIEIGLASNDITAIAIDREENKWFGTKRDGVSKFDGTTWMTYDTSNSRLTSNRISAIAIDGEGNKWFGTEYRGVSKFDGTTWTTYNTSNSGLEDNSVPAIAIDKEGNKWFGTKRGGVSKFDETTWTTYNISNSGLASDYVQCTAIDSTGVKWFGGCVAYEWSPGCFCCQAAVVSRFDGTNWTTYIAGESDLVGREVNAVAIACGGKEWFGTDAGVSVFDGSDWTTYDPSNSGLESDEIHAIAVDNEGTIWFGTFGGGISKYSLPTPPLMPKIFLPYIVKPGVS